jgi:hypothetical protein
MRQLKAIKMSILIFIVLSLISCSEMHKTAGTSHNINSDSQTIVGAMQAYDQGSTA